MESQALHGMRRFVDKNVVVTGGASGIGATTARRFLMEGARVVLVDRNATKLAQTQAELQAISPSVWTIVTDVTQAAQVDAMVEQARGILSRIDILINNAGVANPRPFMEISEENWDLTLDINLKGMFLVGQRVARVMLEQGSGTIVNTASTNGLFAEPRLTDYSVSKGGVVLLTRSMALELAPHGIRVNAVSPGYIRTPMTDRGGEQRFIDYAKKIPLGRVGRPEDVAAVFAFLASDEASFITGECVVTDGGQTIYE